MLARPGKRLKLLEGSMAKVPEIVAGSMRIYDHLEGALFEVTQLPPSVPSIDPPTIIGISVFISD